MHTKHYRESTLFIGLLRDFYVPFNLISDYKMTKVLEPFLVALLFLSGIRD